MGTIVKKIQNILENSKTENLTPETFRYIEEIKLKIDELKKIEGDVINRAYISGYDDCEVCRNKKTNYFLHTYDLKSYFKL